MSTWENLSCGNCFGEAAPIPNLSSLSPSNNRPVALHSSEEESS